MYISTRYVARILPDKKHGVKINTYSINKWFYSQPHAIVLGGPIHIEGTDIMKCLSIYAGSFIYMTKSKTESHICKTKFTNIIIYAYHEAQIETLLGEKSLIFMATLLPFGIMRCRKANVSCLILHASPLNKGLMASPRNSSSRHLQEVGLYLYGQLLLIKP